MEQKKTRKERHEDYEGFVEKYRPKKTTDDCYTPPEVYDCVREWVNDRIAPLEGRRIVRPFFPGGDYENEEYLPGDVVLDNPPFSIMKKIIDFYAGRGIDFFLFAPALTLFGRPAPGVTYICAHCDIVYENGALVRTSFVTNMEGKHRVIVAGDLHKKVGAVTEALEKKHRNLPKYNYPDHLITSAHLGRLSVRGIELKIPMEEAAFVRSLDAMGDRNIFGGGYLISERAAAERAAAERAAAERAAAFTYGLSPREWEVVKSLRNG